MKFNFSSNTPSNIYKPHRVIKWYNKQKRSWVVQVLDIHGNQVGASVYVATKREADSEIKDLMKDYNLKDIDNIKWVKGEDFTDGTPRYTFGGRDPQDSLENIQVVVFTERERRFAHDSQSVKNFYYGYVIHTPSETSGKIGRFETVKEAKQETENMFRKYCEQFPEDI